MIGQSFRFGYGVFSEVPPINYSPKLFDKEQAASLLVVVPLKDD